jgi:predicted nucleic acid-binding protein
VVYVDASAVIYAVEQIEPYRSAGAPLWDALDAGLQQVVTSELTVLEVLIKPLRQGNHALVTLLRQVLLGTTGLSCRPIHLMLIEAAARIRADHNLRTPDAIHAATALECGSAMFVTNDATFRRVPGLNVTVLSEIAAS